MTLKELLEIAQDEEGNLTVESIEEAIAENNVKFADLNEGNYVSKRKYEDDLKAKNTEITGLNDTIKSRDTDLTDLKSKLADAGTDAEKLSTLSNDLTSLQNKYNEDTKALQQQLAKQGYEFAVREFAGTKNFTSKAAKREFINAMIAENLKMSKDGNSIVGAEDFVKEYTAENEDSFVVDEPEDDFDDYDDEPLPMFVNPTQGSQDYTPDPTGGFAQAFHFSTVRPVPNE